MSQNLNTKINFVFHPDNIFRISFDLFGFILIIYQCVMVPFSISFSFQNNSLRGLDYFSDCFFMIDILINFNTGYYLEGVLIMDRKEICKEYLKSWLLFDLVSSFPFSFVFDSIEDEIQISNSATNAPKLLKVIRIARFVKILRLLKMVKFRNLFYKIEDILSSEKIRGFYIYFKTMLAFSFVWHLLSCIWFAISLSEFQNNYTSILTDQDVANFSISNQYLYFLYFVFTTFFTVGYGDIHPKTTNEQVFGIVVMLLSYGLFCYMISAIRNIIQKNIENEQHLKDKLRNVKLFFKDKNLPTDLTSKVTRYLEFMYLEMEHRKLEDGEIFTLLNDKLGDELRIELNKRILLNINLFKKSEFDLIINKFCDKVYEEIINPNEVIITEGDMISSRMYFIDKGNVFLYHDATTIILKELGPNDYFGELGFFTREPRKESRSASAITKTFCNIFFIIQNEFLSLINEIAQSQFKDEILEIFNNKDRLETFRKLEIKCYYCKGEHLIKDCKTFNKADNLIFICKIFI